MNSTATYGESLPVFKHETNIILLKFCRKAITISDDFILLLFLFNSKHPFEFPRNYMRAEPSVCSSLNYTANEQQILYSLFFISRSAEPIFVELNGFTKMYRRRKIVEHLIKHLHINVTL